MFKDTELDAIVEDKAAGRVSAVRHNEGVLSLVLDVSGLGMKARDALNIELGAALRTLDGVDNVRIAMTAERVQRRIIAVASGKGGVGKSTLAANLAIALQRSGRAVGLVDADIYGPSQARLMACEDQRPEMQGEKLVPIATRFGLSVLSMAHIAKPGQAIAWRGPMTGKALDQLIDANWGDVTDLVVDMPPGTGDVQLSMIRSHKPIGAVVVSTPQDLALMDAVRAMSLFDQGDVPIIGLVENMSGYVCPHCNEVSDPFGSGGAEAAAKTMDLDFLGRVPLDPFIRTASDGGEPPAAGDSIQGQAFMAIAQRVAAWVDERAAAAQG